MCVLGGQCATVYRIQWLLVRASPIATPTADDMGDDPADDDDTSGKAADIFVPTMVANHCQCVFS